MTIDDELLAALPKMPWKFGNVNGYAAVRDVAGKSVMLGYFDVASKFPLGEFLCALSHHYAPHQRAVLEARIKLGESQ